MKGMITEDERNDGEKERKVEKNEKKATTRKKKDKIW